MLVQAHVEEHRPSSAVAIFFLALKEEERATYVLSETINVGS